MKFTIILSAALLGSLPLLAQNQASCKAYFQVLQADAGTPGLRSGLSGSQKRWWGEHQKNYPGLCLDGSVTTGDKPRYIVILSKSKSIGQASLAPSEVYGQTSSALQATGPKEWIYQPRWDIQSVTIVSVLYDGSTETPPVYLAAGDTRFPLVIPDSPKVIATAVKYLAQEPAFSPKP